MAKALDLIMAVTLVVLFVVALPIFVAAIGLAWLVEGWLRLAEEKRAARNA